jgi:hypothetical protein
MKYVWFDRTLVASKAILPLVTLVEREYICLYGENSYRQNKQTIECFVANLVYLYKHSEVMNISRHTAWYTKLVVNGKTVSTGIGYASVMKMIYLCEDLGWITSVKGFKNIDTGSKQEGVVMLEDAFIDLIESCIDIDAVGSRPKKTVLVLTKKEAEQTKAEHVNFKMTEEKRLMKSMVEKYNGFMINQVVLDAQGNRLTTSLNRIFNRGDETFSRGGRFYATGNSYQTLPQCDRSKITINGESVFELDFKSIHIAIWCAMNYITLPEGYDVYSMYKDSHYVVDEEKVSYFVNNIKEDYNPLRNIQKHIWLIMINCGKEGRSRKQNRMEAIQAVKKALEEDSNGEYALHLRKFYGVSVPDVSVVVDYIYEAFPFLQDLLYSDMGIKLMKKDSDIMNLILNSCVDKGIPVLCVHDSVLCPQSKVGEVMTLMKQAYQEVCGTLDNCVITVN